VDVLDHNEEDGEARWLQEVAGEDARPGRWENVWLLGAATTVGEATKRSQSVNWKREYMHRVVRCEASSAHSLSVLLYLLHI
jgi:hypothetical protein